MNNDLETLINMRSEQDGNGENNELEATKRDDIKELYDSHIKEMENELNDAINSNTSRFEDVSDDDNSIEKDNEKLDKEIGKLLESDQASDIAPDTLFEIEKALDMPHKDISKYSIEELTAMQNKVLEMYAKLQEFDSSNIKGIPRFKKIPNKKYKSKSKMRKASKKRNRGKR